MPYVITYERTAAGMVRVHRGICQVPLRERLGDKLADLLIAAGDVVDITTEAATTARIWEDLCIDGDQNERIFVPARGETVVLSASRPTMRHVDAFFTRCSRTDRRV